MKGIYRIKRWDSQPLFNWMYEGRPGAQRRSEFGRFSVMSNGACMRRVTEQAELGSS